MSPLYITSVQMLGLKSPTNGIINNHSGLERGGVIVSNHHQVGAAAY